MTVIAPQRCAQSRRAVSAAGELVEQRRIQGPVQSGDPMRIRPWREMFRRGCVDAQDAEQYVSPDGSVFLPAGRVFQQGPPDRGLAVLGQPRYTRFHHRSSR